MIDPTDMELTLRARALSIVVATTGTSALAATASGYTRSSGSFLADGFAPGMEVTPAGFTQTAVGTITAVSALAMTINGGRSAQAEAAGRSLTVKLPSRWRWIGVPFTPVAGHPWMQEGFIDGPNNLRGASIGGFMEQRAQYVLTVHAPIGTGLTPQLYANAIVRSFRPGLVLTLPDGTGLRVRAAPSAPRAGEQRATEPGFEGVTVPIPLWLLTPNLTTT